MTGDASSPSRLEYAIVGTGALGLYYGGLLHRSGARVTFLSMHGQPRAISEQGTPGVSPGSRSFTIASPAGDITIGNPRVATAADFATHCDVALICLKTTQNHFLPELLPRILKPRGPALFLQNGIGVEDEARAVLAPEQMLVGSCYIGVEKVGPGRIRHLDGGRIVLGQCTEEGSAGGITQRLFDVAHELKRAGIPVQPTDDLLRAQWQKLLWNVPFNGLSVLLDKMPHDIVADAQSCELVETIMREVLAAAKATGRPLPESLIPHLINYTRTLPPFRTSMRMDYERGRPMELRTMYENPIRLASEHGVEMPVTEGLFQRLRCLQHESQKNS
jgi:2-dehydropantoate 2-reductase